MIRITTNTEAIYEQRTSSLGSADPALRIDRPVSDRTDQSGLQSGVRSRGSSGLDSRGIFLCSGVSAEKEGGREAQEGKEAEKAQAEKSKDQNDLQALEDYIIKLLDLDYIDARVRKQINDFHDVHHYSYSGIHKALTYFYEVKKNSHSYSLSLFTQ